ncbi:hypothetical protein ACHQM5_004102 [Ranunculus cassubicifolius]
MVMKPAWLQGLMGETFYEVCGVHQNRRKHDKNIFCLDCCRSICPHCLPSHRSHPLLQIRRYVYQDVVQLKEMDRLINCSYIQRYTINSAKVVFLNQRPHSKQYKDTSNACLTCDRILQEPFQFCSVSCKVDHVVEEEGDLSSILYGFDDSEFGFSPFEESSNAMDEDEHEEDDDDEEDQATSNYSIPVHQFMGSSCSSDMRSNNSAISHDSETMTKKTKKKGFFPGLVLSLTGSRRKGAPQRSPLS